MTKLGGKSWNE